MVEASEIFSSIPAIEECDCIEPTELESILGYRREPLVLRGLVENWPLVKAGRQSFHAARSYLVERARQVPFAVSIGPPGQGGRMFYNDQMGMNFRTGTASLADIFAGFDRYEGEADGPTAYLASIDIREHFSSLAEENPHPLGKKQPLESIWIGGPTRIAAHNDFPHNIACCAVGTRRFTLFPPEQFRNLYLGPLDNTPAGRAVSMVDFHRPDFEQYPAFREALSQASVTTLEPGDALFIPSMWWHHVEGLSDFNVLINYWWRDTPKWLGQPQDAMNHAIFAIRELPSEEKAIWREMFEYYVFDDPIKANSHIPTEHRGILDPLTPVTADRLRQFLLRSLNK